MRIFPALLMTAVAIVTGVWLAACATAGSTPSQVAPPLTILASLPSSRADSMNAMQILRKQEAGEGLIYASASYYDFNIFTAYRPHKVVGQLRKPLTTLAIAVDKKGNAYEVVQAQDQSELPTGVYVYAPGSTAPFEDLETVPYSYQPKGVAIARNGLVAVISTGGSGSPGTITFFPPASTKVCNVIQGFAAMPGYGAFDSKGHLFVLGYGPGSTYEFGEVTGGCHAKSVKTLDLTGLTYQYVYDMQIDASDNLVVLASNNYSNALDIFPPGALSPSQAVSLTVPRHTNGFTFRFNKSGKHLWLAAGEYYQYNYPAGGNPISHLPPSQANGGSNSLAVFPPVDPGRR